MNANKSSRVLIAASTLLAQALAHAYTFETEGGTRVSFDSTISVGTGIRAGDPNPDLVLQGNTGGPAGNLWQFSGVGDQGNLNYKAGQPFTTYLKGTHELAVQPSEDLHFLARVSWLKDFAATKTTGYSSVNNPGTGVGSDGLTDEARQAMDTQTRVLDFWVSKAFDINGERARVRAGNQVISWGESLFTPGGINTINAMDVNRLSQPGTQLKEAVIPAPMISMATGLGHGLNVEAYVQTNWNPNVMPPTGSYWSTVDGMGAGSATYSFGTRKAKDSGQWGVSLRFQPKDTDVNLGFYSITYHDKAPQATVKFDPNQAAGFPNLGWVYPEDRQLYGVSANFPVGGWAVGTELSYRPKDAVALNSGNNCAGNNNNCWVDEEKYQLHLTGIYSLTPTDSPRILKLLGADNGNFLIEAVGIFYPNLKTSYNGDLVSSGAYAWGQLTSASGTSVSKGTTASSGVSFDFSWTYDSSLIKGWQVVPEIFYSRALNGYTPTGAATFMEGASSLNMIVSFVQNPAKWQFAVNYATFWGGQNQVDQPLRDRSFLGLNMSRNF